MTRPTLRLTTLCCAAAVLTLALAGCTGISVQRVKAPDLLDAWRASILDADELSPRSQQTLRQLDLDRLYLREPSLAYSRLQALAVRDAQPDYLFALAEMSYLFGRKAERWENPNAVAFYYFSAAYAYHYLFSNDALTPVPGPER